MIVDDFERLNLSSILSTEIYLLSLHREGPQEVNYATYVIIGWEQKHDLLLVGILGRIKHQFKVHQFIIIVIIVKNIVIARRKLIDIWIRT